MTYFGIRKKNWYIWYNWLYLDISTERNFAIIYRYYDFGTSVINKLVRVEITCHY